MYIVFFILCEYMMKFRSPARVVLLNPSNIFWNKKRWVLDLEFLTLWIRRQNKEKAIFCQKQQIPKLFSIQMFLQFPNSRNFCISVLTISRRIKRQINNLENRKNWPTLNICFHNDTNFQWYFIKKEKPKFVNVWTHRESA